MADLCQVLGVAIAKNGVDVLEVGRLLVNEPLPDRHLGLRNGAKLQLSQAIDLVVGMAGGLGPYCQLSIPGKLQIGSGWDGAVHLYTTREVAADLARLHCQDATFRWRDTTPDDTVIQKHVGAVADDKFWEGVAKVSDRFTLLCERWAYGACGCRWFRVTRENVTEVARLMRPRSLVCVASDPAMELRPELLEDDFTAFVAPLMPGELLYRAYPGGADALSEVTSEGFSLMLPDSVMDDWCAMVPDSDEVHPELWHSSEEP